MTTLPLPRLLRGLALPEAPAGPARLTRRARRDATLDAAADAHLSRVARLDLRHRWPIALQQAGLGQATFTPMTGQFRAGLPLIAHVDLGTATADPYLICTMPPGLSVADLDEQAPAIARALDVHAVRCTPRGPNHVRVDLVSRDPLAAVVPYPLDVPTGHVGFGVDETGRLASIPFDDLPHLAVQGSTGAGKSAAAYAILAQLHRFGPLVDVVGIDPTGLLLRPWGPHPRGWRVSGTGADAADRYAAVLRELVDDMDARIAELPPRCDRMTITPGDPLRLVVLEELPGISRLTGYRPSGQPSEVQRLIGRLAGEGRKAGYRLFVIGQRLGADVLSTDVRDQLLGRWTYGCRDLATLRMLSPEAGPEDLAPLADSPPGVALADLPGRPLTRMRSPWVGGYGAYCDLVDHAPTAPG